MGKFTISMVMNTVMWKFSRGYQQHLWTPNTIRCGKGSLLNAWSEWWWCWDAQMLRFWIDWDGQRASGSFSFGLVAAVLKFPVGYSEKINMFINSLKVDSLRERVWFNVLFFLRKSVPNINFQLNIFFNWCFAVSKRSEVLDRAEFFNMLHKERTPG